MNDVLPKPFTKEGLLQMLEKHLAHLKKPGHGMETMVPPPPVQPLAHSSARKSLKSEDSPAKSPATNSNWNSPSQIPGVSPVESTMPTEYMNAVPGHPAAAYGGMPPSGLPAAYNSSPHMPMPLSQQHSHQHRRQISEISGGDDMGGTPNKRQAMFAPPLQPQPMPQMGRPR